MASAMSPSLLRATRIRFTRLPNSQHLPSSSHILTTRISQPSPPPPPPSSTLHHLRLGRRSFHWQATAEAAIAGTQDALLTLHGATHLPWFLTIPLAAFAVGAAFRLPFTIHTQRVLQRRGSLGPLLQAWNSRLQEEVHRAGVAPARRLREVRARQNVVVKRLHRALGLQEWRLYAGILSFPFWLVAIDGVRRLCGSPRGLIATLIAGSAAGSSDKITTAATTGTEAAAAGPPPLPLDLDPTMASSAAVETTSTGTAALLDPSLTFEGCLWFTDLTASDPYHVLPVALSTVLVLNLLPRTRQQLLDRLRVAAGRRPEGAGARALASDDAVALGERVKAVFHVGMLVVAVLVGPLTADLPAALHLYWIASSATNALFTRLLRRLMPAGAKLQQRCAGLEMPFIRPQRWQKS